MSGAVPAARRLQSVDALPSPAVERQQWVAEIDRELRSGGSRERAVRERAYLKSRLEHYGTPVPDVRAAVRAVRRRAPELSRSEVVGLAEALWDAPVHERRLSAVELLVAYLPVLEARDIDLVEGFVREAGTWALVDPLAGDVAGRLVERCPELGAVLDRWAADGDFWIRRSALLALLRPLRAGGGDFERFGGYADRMLEEREFLIRKAIGWVLRDTAKRRPELVYDWILPRADRASGVTIREAVKPLSPDQRAAVLAAQAARSPQYGRGR
jgi:3-methyladenine DNA glycosylase AlkD